MNASSIDAAGACVAYRAALDREESASHAYADLLGISGAVARQIARGFRRKRFDAVDRCTKRGFERVRVSMRLRE